jgi:hypothetical protein
LAYARILRDYDRPDLPFKDYYELPAHFQPYFASHYLIAALGHVLTIDSAVRLIFSAYVIAMFFAFRSVVRAIHRPGPGERLWSSALASFVIWNPIAAMGFFEFTLSLPLVLAGVALVLTDPPDVRTKRASLLLVICAAALVSVHPVAAGCLLLVAWIHAAVNPARARLARAGLVTLAAIVAFALWAKLGETGIESKSVVDWAEAMRETMGLEFINNALRIRWYDPAVNASYALWTLFGPFRLTAVAFVAICYTIAAWIIATSRRGEPSNETSHPIAPALRMVLVFSISTWLVPWGLDVPTEITFLNFRLMTIAFAMGLACVPPRWLLVPRARKALVAACAFGAVHFGWRAAAFGREASAVLSLLEEAKPLGPMLTLDYHEVSEQFGKLFRVTHFLPMYYTVRHGGINAQFWARYTPHLPIGYRAGKEFHGPPDWRPVEFQPQQIGEFDYVLMKEATEADKKESRAASLIAGLTLQQKTDKVRCDDGWCLYRVRH